MCDLPRLLRGPAEVLQNQRGFFMKELPGLGQHNASACFSHKSQPQLFFQQSELLRQGGLCNMKALSGAGDVPFFRDSAERLEMSQFHTGGTA